MLGLFLALVIGAHPFPWHPPIHTLPTPVIHHPYRPGPQPE